MSKEQIEKMAKVIHDVAEAHHIIWCTELAKILYNAGYRKKSEGIANNATTTGEWISVEERLPSEEERRDASRELVPFLVVERDTEYPYRAFYDGMVWGDGLMKIRGITHWMHLPEPPKKGDEGK